MGRAGVPLARAGRSLYGTCMASLDTVSLGILFGALLVLAGVLVISLGRK